MPKRSGDNLTDKLNKETKNFSLEFGKFKKSKKDKKD